MDNKEEEFQKRFEMEKAEEEYELWKKNQKGESDSPKAGENKNKIVLTVVLVVALLIFVIAINKNSGDNYADSGGQTNSATGDGQMTPAPCDYVDYAIHAHDPRNVYKMATTEEANIYKTNMRLAADAFREIQPDVPELAVVASEMANGFKSNAVALLDYCGIPIGGWGPPME